MMETGAFSLPQLQSWMQGMLLHPAGDMDAQINGIVHSSRRLSAARHLSIYQGSYIARLRECMRTQFSALAYALGGDLFDAFTSQYLEACPSHSYTLNELGRKFPSFLQETRPDAAEEQKEDWPDFMIGLAGFEYAISLIFDEYSDGVIYAADEGAPDDAMRLTPVFHLFHHQFPICNYYLAFIHGQGPELPLPQESFCVVLRHNYRLGFFVVNPAQYFFLSRIKQGAPVSSSIGETAQEYHIAPAAMAALWVEWRKNFINSAFFVR